MPDRSGTRLSGKSCSVVAIFIALIVCLATAGCQRRQRRPDQILFAVESNPTTLDPRIGVSEVTQHIYEMMFNSLVRRDENFQYAPDLAERWETPDPRTFIFHLRPNVRFHNGKLLTSADVRYTLESLRRLATPKAGSFSKIAAIDTPDDRTVIFRLTEPYLEFMVNLVRPAIGIVPDGSPDDFSRNPIGTGPFRFVRFAQDDEVELQAFDQYFGGAPTIPSLVFRVIPDETTRALELRNGSIDIVLNSLSPDMVFSLKEQPHLQVENGPGTRYQYLAFNFRDTTLARPEVRRAIAHSLDRDNVIRHLFRGLARPADSIFPPFHWAYHKPSVQYAYDPARARRLLDEAGFPDPDQEGPRTRFRLVYKSSNVNQSVELAQIIQEQLHKVGVGLDIRTYEIATVLADIRRGNFQLYSLRWIGANLFTDIFSFVFHSKMAPPAGANRGYYSNAEVDRLVDQANLTTDQEERAQIFNRLQDLVAADLPYVSLLYPDNVVVFNKRLKGIRLIPSGDYIFLQGASIQQDGAESGQP
ncbi:MAG: ABC transporter substrate-binding protein [Acidobacteriota bacterium]